MNRKQDLINFINNSKLVNTLEKQIIVENKCIDAIDAEIETAIDDKVRELLIEKRNQINLERIGLELKRNHLEKEILLFEFDQATLE